SCFFFLKGDYFYEKMHEKDPDGEYRNCDHLFCGGVTSAQDSLYEYGMTPVSIENGKLVSGNAIHNDAATADIQTSNMTGTTDQYYGHFFFGNADINNTSFDNNTLKTDGPNGVVYFNSSVKLYPTSYEVETPNTVTVTNSSFNGNKIESTGGTASIYSTSKAGAVMIKGTNVTFNDVAFNDNAASGGTHAQAMGGAVYLDTTSNTANHDGQKRVLKASATFNVTKDTTYAGNKVSGVDAYSDTYGSYAKTGGGFMYMDRGGEANFNVADGVTLKIGKDGETDANTDSIASAIRGSHADYGENIINKEGLGTLSVNGSMSGYHGDLNVKEGTMNINQSLAGDAKISVSDGATLNLKEVELSSQSGIISVANSNGVMTKVTLPERDGSLVAQTGSKVTAKTITLKNKSSMKVETGATVTADSVAVADEATLRAESHSNLDVKQVKVEDPTKKGQVQLMGDFSGKFVKSDGTALTAAETQNVMAKADNDNSRMDITAQNGESATSLLQGDDGSFAIQNKDYANGGATKVLASYDKDGTYDAHGNDMKNVGAISAKSLSVGQIGDVETAINKNAAGIQRLDGRIDKVGANAAALAALHPLDYDALEKWSVAAGVGNYGSENAMAVGAFYRPNEDVMLNMAGSFGSGENMVNAGISFKVGQRGAKVVKAESADVKALQEKVEAQDKEIKELREMVEKLVAKA
ncbi:MAG: YadA-like family protein, partial [Dialister sp.]|nr:YadA-like family protein [Dialister sp.]